MTARKQRTQSKRRLQVAAIFYKGRLVGARKAAKRELLPWIGDNPDWWMLPGTLILDSSKPPAKRKAK